MFLMLQLAQTDGINKVVVYPGVDKMSLIGLSETSYFRSLDLFLLKLLVQNKCYFRV